jgi:hypothetical protein
MRRVSKSQVYSRCKRENFVKTRIYALFFARAAVEGTLIEE